MEYEFEVIAKEIVVSRLKDADDAHAVAADVARAILIPAVTSTHGRQDARLTVVAVCRGVMEGLNLLDKDLSMGAVALLGQMGTAARESYLDPADCMTWAIEGIATVCGRKLPVVRAAVESQFPGTGAAFDKAAAP